MTHQQKAALIYVALDGAANAFGDGGPCDAGRYEVLAGVSNAEAAACLRGWLAEVEMDAEDIKDGADQMISLTL
jgi:hypothetical protein